MIHLRGVSKQFDGKRKVTALQRVDLEIARGDMVSIVGPSGAGKSTLLNLIGGLDRPSEGEIEIDGAALSKLNDDQLTRVRRDKIGFIFQFFNLLPALTALENVSLPLHLRSWPRKKIDERARELLDLVQLGSRLDHLPDELSGGERQRVAIARALSVYPPILLADEPTGNLDSTTGAEILRLIHDLHDRLGATVLMVTHDATVAESCPRTIHIRDGNISLDVRRAGNQKRRNRERNGARMRLLRLISWPYARKHMLRWLLTTAGIVLGVAVFVGMHTANQSVLAAFHQTIDRIAGTTQLQVSAGEAGFDEDVLDKVQSIPEVRAAGPVIEATTSTGRYNFLILGVDMLGDRNLRKYDMEGTDDAIDDPLVFLAQPDSLIVTRAFADQGNLAVNSRVPMSTMNGNLVFTVRGIMKPGGLASAFGGNLAVMDIYAAQKVFGRGRKFDRIDVALQDGVTLSDATAKLQSVLGPGFQVEPPGSRGEQFEATSRIYSLASNITSVFALFIGMFIIYNTFAIAVTQRRSEIGILRALGATRAQIRAMFLTESAFSGLAGTLGGIALGILLARAMSGYISGLLADVYGVAQSASDIVIDPRLIGIAIVMGMVTSLIAAVIPARSAAHVDPVKALQKGSYQSLSEGENRMRKWAAIACGAASVAAFALSQYKLVFYAGPVLVALAAVLLAPALSVGLARLLRPAFKWMRPVEGALAADSLIQSPRRTSGTVAALMLSLALVISLGGLSRSSYNTLAEWMRIALNPDLFVTTSQSMTTHSFVFSASLGGGLRAIDGVADVQPVRTVRELVKNTPIMIMAGDIGAISQRAKLPAVEGNPDEMYLLTSAGKGLIASENFARLHGARLGEVIEIPAPAGILRLPVVGIVRDFSDQQGSLLIARDTFIRYWNDDGVNIFRVYLKPGAQEADVRQRILDAFGTQQRLFVLTNRDLRAYVIRLTDQWFGLTYVQIAVAVLIAVLGIVNTLTVSIVDRRRELGVLRAVGGLRPQIRHTVWMEAVAIGVTGLVLGLGLGAIQLYYTVQIARRDLIGVDVGYAYPFQTVLALVPVILAVSWLASLGPAESAVRGSLVEALEYE